MLFRHRHRHNNSLTSLKEQTHSPKCDNTTTLDPKTQAWLKESAALVGPRANGNDGRRRFVLNGQLTKAQDHSLPKRTPTSRKTGFATIRTDSTDSQAAFESDAFAVLMPTTRVPILDQPATSVNTATRAARAEAYKTYQEKAREMRERNDSQGVQVPSELVTYGPTNTRATQCTSMQVEITPPNSPARPAGAFPISPPLLQTGWSSPDRSREAPRAERSNICTPRKPVTPTKTTTTPPSHYRIYRTTLDDGESRSQTPSPPTIKIRLRPKQSPQSVRMASTQKIPQLTPQQNGSSIRAISPSKSMPNFTRHNSVEGDSIFGYRTKDITGTSVGAADTTPPKSSTKASTDAEKPPPKDLAKDKSPKRTFASKWPWLRSTTPKPTTPADPPPPPPTTAPNPRPATYIDPFTVYVPPTTTPPCLSPPTHASAPRKLARTPTAAAHSTPQPPTHNFATGLTQLTTLLSLLLKAGLVIYAVVAVWYIVDAAREAVNAFCAPFRAVRWVGGWVGVVLLWVVRVGMVLWERWGVKVVVKGGWMWKVRWV